MSIRKDEYITFFDDNWMSVIDGNADYALELWIVRMKEDLAGHKIIYGRTFIFSFSNDKWNYSSNNNYKLIGEQSLQLLRISLYTKGANVLNVLKKLTQGKSINIATKESGLEITPKFEKEIGHASLIGPVIYKPGYYMFNRDADHPTKIKSPHYKIGGYCHSLSQSMKGSIFSFDGELTTVKASYLLTELKKQVGIEFRDVNSSRVGDIEIISFPLTDAYHKSSLEVKVGQDRDTIEIYFKTHCFCDNEYYYATIKIFNGKRLIYSVLSKQIQDNIGSVLISINVEKNIISMIDTLEVELYGSKGTNDEFQLITQWNMPYIREVSMSSNVLGNLVIIDNKWLLRGLKKETPKSRITSASIVNVKRDGPRKIVSRKNEDWILNDRYIGDVISKIYPEDDKGGFFQRISHGNKLGRLEFSEWLQKTLRGFEQGSVIFFDPYF